jgi:hypothetical protein
MVASIETKVAVIEDWKNFQINLNFRYAPGFTYSVLNTQFRGYVDLAASVSSTLHAVRNILFFGMYVYLCRTDYRFVKYRALTNGITN